MAPASELIVLVAAGAACACFPIVVLLTRRSRRRRSEQLDHVLYQAEEALEAASTAEQMHLIGVHAALDILGQEEAAVELQVGGAMVGGAAFGSKTPKLRAQIAVGDVGTDAVLVVYAARRMSRQERAGLQRLVAKLALEPATPPVDLSERRTA